LRSGGAEVSFFRRTGAALRFCFLATMNAAKLSRCGAAASKFHGGWMAFLIRGICQPAMRCRGCSGQSRAEFEKHPGRLTRGVYVVTYKRLERKGFSELPN
jgi:hypothetical protein